MAAGAKEELVWESKRREESGSFGTPLDAGGVIPIAVRSAEVLWVRANTNCKYAEVGGNKERLIQDTVGGIRHEGSIGKSKGRLEGRSGMVFKKYLGAGYWRG